MKKLSDNNKTEIRVEGIVLIEGTYAGATGISEMTITYADGNTVKVEYSSTGNFTRDVGRLNEIYNFKKGSFKFI